MTAKWRFTPSMPIPLTHMSSVSVVETTLLGKSLDGIVSSQHHPSGVLRYLFNHICGHMIGIIFVYIKNGRVFH